MWLIKSIKYLRAKTLCKKKFEKFYIYDNESDDNLKEVLMPYIEDGLVDYTYLPGEKMQVVAYQDAVDKHKMEKNMGIYCFRWIWCSWRKWYVWLYYGKVYWFFKVVLCFKNLMQIE